MLSICEDYGKEFDVKFNATKTVCICFSADRKPVQFYINFNGLRLDCRNNVNYLGCYIMHNLRECVEIQKKRNDFIARTNSLIYTFNTAQK